MVVQSYTPRSGYSCAESDSRSEGSSRRRRVVGPLRAIIETPRRPIEGFGSLPHRQPPRGMTKLPAPSTQQEVPGFLQARAQPQPPALGMGSSARGIVHTPRGRPVRVAVERRQDPQQRHRSCGPLPYRLDSKIGCFFTNNKKKINSIYKFILFLTFSEMIKKTNL